MTLRRFAFASTALLSFAAHADEVVVPLEARKALELTIYENDLALVKDQRDLKLPKAEATLAFAGVSRQLQPDTVLFRTLSGDALKVVEQTFDFDVISQQALLQRSLGQDVGVYTANPSTGRDTIERAKVIGVDQGIVLDIGGKIHAQVPGRIVFDALPAGLRATPTLLITARGTANKDVKTELSYLTSGLSWQTTYVAEYDADAKKLDLAAWATITNSTGGDFKSAKVKLISGQVNRAAPRPVPMPKVARRGGTEMMAMAAPAADMQEQSFGGYHMYDIATPVSIENNRTKQLSLLGGTGISAQQEYIVRGEAYYYQQQLPERPPVSQAETVITMKNDKASGLGLPLPAGVVRVYGQDADGAPQFLGESQLEHTAEGADIRIVTGRDFDVTAQREQKSFVRASDRVSLAAWTVTLRNAKAKPVTVKVVEPIAGSWEITRETLPRDKSNAQMAQWTVTVPARSQVALDYSVKITY
ncbi:MAG: DUF4139 domain-containing protein [Rhodospirillaceae bacterium]|nr:DUF4139 domain-containing protein [Rhodospirillaceae bacterium]